MMIRRAAVVGHEIARRSNERLFQSMRAERAR